MRQVKGKTEKMMVIPVIYEDDELLVINKPRGVICNRASTVKEDTLQDWMQKQYGHKWSKMAENEQNLSEDEKYFLERVGLVHRLDKETSGVMVLAKNARTFIELLKQFKARETRKEYIALTHGIWNPKEGVITLPIGRAQHNRQMMSVREDGRESMTEYRVEQEWKNVCEEKARLLKVNTRGYAGFSRVRFFPKTGRMHQIRVHAKHLGHPLVGDEIYAGRKRSREDRKWCEKLMLTAVLLEFTHPLRGRMTFEAKDDEIQNVSLRLC